MSEKYTIAEEYTLPSKGKVYDTSIDPVVKLRSMTTEEEMKRLGHSERQYKILADIIDDCIVDNKLGMSVYDLCIGDYQFLLHKLRIITYGSDYSMESICPYCGEYNKQTFDLESLEINEYTDDLEKYFSFELPKSKKMVRIKMQSPRSLDDIAIRAKEYAKKHPDAEGDISFLYTLVALIDTIDGQHYDQLKLEQIVRKLPMMDSNYILKCAGRLNNSIGINTALTLRCKGCGVDYDTTFRLTNEFFGPSVDI